MLGLRMSVLDPSWAFSCVMEHRNRCHFSDSVAGRSPTKRWPVVSGPWYLPYNISPFTSYLECMVRTPVQTNHMCDCPNRLHIDVVGTAVTTSVPDLCHQEIPLHLSWRLPKLSRRQHPSEPKLTEASEIMSLRHPSEFQPQEEVVRIFNFCKHLSTFSTAPIH